MTNEIEASSPFDAIRETREDGSEFWSARRLMPLMGYANWQNFTTPLLRAIKAAENQGFDLDKLFMRSHKKTAGKPLLDYELSRFAAYLVAMNGDPNKAEVAAGQAYFVIRAREAEVAEVRPLPTRKELARWVWEAEDRAELADKARREAEDHARALSAPAAAWQQMVEARGDYAVADAAKALSRDPAITIGRDHLFTFMAGQGWVFRERYTGRWKAYQTQINTGRLAEKASRPSLNPNTGEWQVWDPSVRVTPKGLEELHRRLGGSGPLVMLSRVDPDSALEM